MAKTSYIFPFQMAKTRYIFSKWSTQDIHYRLQIYMKDYRYSFQMDNTRYISNFTFTQLSVSLPPLTRDWIEEDVRDLVFSL